MAAVHGKLWLNGDRPTSALVIRGFPLLEFDRAPVNRDVLRGFALGWNAELTLIAVIDDVQFRLNGYAIFRSSDVKRWRAVSTGDFLARAAKLNKLHPKKPVGVCFASMKQALASAGAAFPLITIHRERIDRTICEVGRLLRTNQRAMTIRAISPQAEWEREERYQLRDITLLEFGGAYEILLSRMATQIDGSV